MNTTVYLVRHGQTEWNMEKRLQGRLDSPLTEKGVEQAKQLAQRLIEIPFYCIYSRSSNRAFQTASHLRGERKIDLIKTDYLMEMSFAKWEGKKWAEIQTLFPEELELISNHPEQYKATESQGETFYDVQDRVVSFVRRILEQHLGESILLVSHAIAIKVLVNYFCGGSLRTVWEGPYVNCASLYQLCFSTDGVKILFEGEEIV